MWMGTYPSVPTYVLSNGELLKDFLSKHPQLVGKGVMDRYGADIPFIPKVWECVQLTTVTRHGEKEDLH